MKVRAISFFHLFLIVVFLAGAFLQPNPVYAASLPAEINKQFTPLQIDAGGTSVLRISIFNPNTFPLTNVAFTDNLVRVQPGMFVDTPNGVVNTCGGTVTAVPGSTTITLSGGGVIAQTGSTPGSCYVEVNVSSTTAGNLINTIPAHNPPADIGLTADGVDGGVPVTITNTTPASATITVIGVSPPSLSKAFAPNTIFVGAVSTLTITLNNNDVDTNLTGTSYTDTLPAGLQIANPANLTSTGCGAGSTVTAPVGGTTIALSGATVTPSVNCVITVNVLGATYGQYLNRIPAGPAGVGSIRTDQGVTNGSNADANLNVQPVGVVKAFLPTTIDAGDTTTLTITLQNPNAAAQPVTSVLDTLPADLIITGTPTTNCGVGSTVAYDPTPPARWVFTGASIPAAVTPPTPGTCTITAILQATFSATGNRTNTIGPNSIVTPTIGFTNYNTTSSTVTINPAFTAAKAYTSPSYRTIPLGGTATVTVTLTNNSSTDITDVDFTDTLPTGLTVSGTPASPQCGGGTVTSTATSVTLANGTIPANTSCTVVFDVTSTTPGVYDNTIPANDITACTATLGCVGNPTTVSTNPDLTVIDAAQLPVTVAKSFLPVVVSAGQPSRVRITITAPQDIAISQINITDTLPAGVVVAPNTPPTPAPTESCPGGTLTAVPDSGTITFTNLVTNTLAAGASCNIDVYVVAANPGSYDNDIPANQITTSQGRTNTFPSNTANLRVTGLTMSKAFYPTTVQANGISRLTITLENSIPEALTNVILTDNLPGTATNGIIIAPTPNATTTCGGGTVNAVAGALTFSLAGGTIPAQSGGVPGLCTISVNVQGRDSTPASQSTQTNNIPVNLVSGTIPSLGVTMNPAAPAQATLTIRNLSIGVVKGFNPVLVYGGATSLMTVRLINPETTALTGVAFTDNMALLSPGIILANPPAFNTGACGGTLTGNPGDSSFSFSGGTILPNSFCELTLRVVMNVNGNRTNRIPVGAVTTANGTNNTQATEASLTNLPGVSVNKVFNPNPVQINQVSRLTINITNTSSIPVVNMGVFDNLPGNLPDGVAVAAVPNVANTCNGTVTANPGAQSITLIGGSIAGSGSCQISVDVVSTRPGVYVNTIPAGALTADGGVTNNDSTTDTLTVGTLFSLGNRVWFDTNNNSLISTGEVGVDGVVVQLYAADGSGSPTGPVLGTQTTSLGGYYRFDNLPEGDYVAVIPADNFRDVGAGDLAPTNPLAGYWSSGTSLSGGSPVETAAPDPDNDIDNDDNGTRQTVGAFAGAVISNAVTLGTSAAPAEPTNDTDAPTPNPAGEAADNRSNRTVDFGFYRTTVGDLIYYDANTSGTFGAGDTPLGGAIVQVFASDGTTEINVGPDGIWGTTDDAPGGITTGANGLYSFVGLPNGDYIIRVTPPVGYYSTVDTNNPADTADPDFNINNNDNGIGAVAGPVNWSSGILTVTAGETGPIITVTNSDGTTADPSVDFGFVSNSYSVGNRVWFDTDNSSTINGAEVGVGGVRVNLYQDNGTTAGVFDPGDTFLAFDTTDAGGYYRFDGLVAGNYVITIPADNFRNVGAGDTVAGDPLAGYWSSGTTLNAAGTVAETASPDPDNNTDNDDNGNTTLSGNSINYVSAIAVTLGPGTPEPTTDNDPATNPEPGEAPNNRSNRTVDFGFYRMQLGNLVFVDSDGNGAYNTGESVLAGATVQLFASNGTTEINVGPDGIFGTADDAPGGVTTGAGGTYQFSGLPAGDYIVRVTPPAGYGSTVDTADAADTADPDTNTDNNDNGIGTASGLVSSGLVTLTPGQGTGGSAGAANNVVTNSTGTTSDPTVDFGFVSTLVYSLGNRVWFDTNNDSLLNGAEVGVNNVRVELYRDNGTTPGVYDAGDTFVGFDVTDVNGYYRFDDLTAGEYVVLVPSGQFDTGGPLNGYWSSGTSLSNAGAVSDTTTNDPDTIVVDSDDNGRTTFSAGVVDYVASAAVTLGPGTAEPAGDDDPVLNPEPGEAPNNQSDRTVDFGFYRGQLGNLVYVDVNGNGTYDAGETTLAGATVQLFAGDGTTEINVGPDGILGTADDAAGGVITGAGGTYQFSGLPAGDYIVRVTPPSGYTSTVDTAVPADTTSPNANADNNDNGVGTAGGAVSSNPVTLTPGSTGALTNNTVTNATGTTYNPTLDFGFTAPLFSLGNRVWFDTDNSATINGTEIGVNGVTVQLYAADAGGNPTGAVLRTAATANGGYYRFDNLTAGDYVVVIPTSQFNGGPLTGYWSSGTTLSGTGAVNEAVAPDPDNDTDSDDNGTRQTAGTFSGAVISAAITLGPNTDEPVTDADADPTNPAGEAPDAQSNRTVDFGFYRMQLGNLVYVDTNGNGTYDTGETTLAGATVQLFASNGTTEINVGPDGILGTADDAAGGVTTGAGGTYLFSGLPEGDYIVRVTPPAVYTSTVDTAIPADTTNPNTNADNNDNGVGIGAGTVSSNVVTLVPGSTGALTNNTVTNASGTTYDPTVDFGFVTTLYSLGNRVWLDNGAGGGTADDGLRNGTEPGINNVIVNLYQDSNDDGTPDGGVIATTTTDANGYYRFDNLAAGTYIVEVVTPAGYASTVDAGDPDIDTDDNDDNGVVLMGANVRSNPVTLGPGGSEPDFDNDPVTNPEPGEAPNNQSNRTVDFGFVSTANRVSLGSTVFSDVNGNGLQDAGETGISGVLIQLYLSTQTPGVDAPVAVTTTDVNGNYFFGGLLAGSYVVYIPTPPASAPLSSSPAVTDTADNSEDGDDNGIQTASGQPVISPVIVLTVDGEMTNETYQGGTQDDSDDNNGDMTVDFGFVPTSTLVADPAISKAGDPSRATVGETVVFTLTVTNTGNAPADNVVVTDPVPATFDVISVTSVYQAGGNAGTVVIAPAGPAPSITNVTVTLGTLDITDVVIITVTTRVNASGNPPFNNTARLSTTSLTNRTVNDASSAIIRARAGGSSLPATGFAPNVVTDLPTQPQNLKYAATDVILEIPSLGIKLPVVGIPKKNGSWDVTWLGKQAGWLEGTAFPSWNGNSVLTSHVYLSNGLPGPFVGLNKLKYGDKIIVHAYGEKYTFEVRTNAVIEPNDVSIMKHEEKPWLTLVTCKEYDEKTNTYKKRVAVRAVLVKVEADK